MQFRINVWPIALANLLFFSRSNTNAAYHDEIAAWESGSVEEVCNPSSIVVAIKSGAWSLEQQDRRNIWRKSDCARAYRDAGIRYKFLLGFPVEHIQSTQNGDEASNHGPLNGEGKDLITLLEEEQKENGDLEFLPIRDIEDNYSFLKTYQTLQWVDRQEAIHNIAVVHEDEFCIDLDEVVAMCSAAKGSHAHLYGGQALFDDSHRQRGSPPYFGREAYVLSRPLVKSILSIQPLLSGNHLPHSEDIRLGHWVDLQVQGGSNKDSGLGRVLLAEHGTLLLLAARRRSLKANPVSSPSTRQLQNQQQQTAAPTSNPTQQSGPGGPVPNIFVPRPTVAVDLGVLLTTPAPTPLPAPAPIPLPTPLPTPAQVVDEQSVTERLFAFLRGLAILRALADFFRGFFGIDPPNT